MRSDFFKKSVVVFTLTISLLGIAFPIAAQQTPDPNQTGTGALYNSSGQQVGTATPTPKAEISCDKLTTCLALMVYYVGPGLAGYAAYIGAYFFSIVIQISLNSTAYALDFLSTGWVLVRDIANMAFIFILIYIALLVILKAETSGTMRNLALVVIMALLINFSFFFTRVVIDAGNLLAVQFYNAVAQPIAQKYGSDALINGSTVDLSYPIMEAVRPQTLLSTNSFQKAKDASNNSDWGALTIVSVVYIFTAVMFWILFFAFITVGIKFMLRIVGLWFVLISSPLAFVSKAIPAGGVSAFFKQWLDMLIQLSLYPAIFMFMYFILTKIINGANGTNGLLSNNVSGSGGIFDAVINTSATAVAGAPAGPGGVIASVAIRMGIVIAVLYVGLRVSDWVVKQGSSIAHTVLEKGNGVSGFINSIPGWAAQKAGGYAYSYGIARTAANDIDRLKKNPPKTWLGQFVDYQYRNKVLKPIADKSIGGVSYPGIQKARDERRKDWEGNVENLQARNDAKRMAEINKTWEAEEKKLKEFQEMEKRGYPADMLSTPNKREYERLQALSTERAILSKRIEGLSKSQLTSLKAADIEGIVKQLSEKNMDAIKESGKYTAKAIDGMMSKWHEESKKAPMAEAKKQLDELGKIRDILKEKRGLDDIATLLPNLEKFTRSGGEYKFSLSNAEAMKKEVDALREEKDLLRQSATSKEEKQAAGRQANDLRKAVTHLEKLIEKIKDVPEQTGGEPEPAAFKHTAKAAV